MLGVMCLVALLQLVRSPSIFCYRSCVLMCVIGSFAMLNIEEVKYNVINCGIKLVSHSSTITVMHGPIYIRYITNIEVHFVGYLYIMYHFQLLLQ